MCTNGGCCFCNLHKRKQILYYPPSLYLQFSEFVFICDLQVGVNANCFTMKQIRRIFIYKRFSFLSVNVFHRIVSVMISFVLLFVSAVLGQPLLPQQTCSPWKWLREFQVLGRKIKQSSQQAGLTLITGKYQIKTNSHNSSTWLRVVDCDSWAFIELRLEAHPGELCV